MTRYSNIHFSSRHFQHQIHKRIDGDFMLGRYQRRGKWQLDDPWTAHGRADGELLVIINRRVDEFALGTGKKNCAFALERGARVAAAFALRGEFWLGDFPTASTRISLISMPALV